MRRLTWFLLLLFAFAIPWEYSLDLGPPLGNIARIAGLVLLLAAIPAIAQAGRLRTPGSLQWLVLAYFVWFCCSLFWSIDFQITLAKVRGYFQEFMVVWLVWEFAETPTDLRNLLRAYVAGCWVLAVLTVMNLGSPGASSQIRFAAVGQDPNDVARFIDLGFPMAALLLERESKWAGKLLAWGYLPLGLTGVLLTASRGGSLAALVAMAGCGLLMIRSRRPASVGAVVASPLLLAFLWLAVPRGPLARIGTIYEQLRGGDLNQRFNLWHAGWQAFAHAPFLGSGAGSFVSAARLSTIDTAHNTALAIVVEGGICALFLATAILAVSVLAVSRTHGAVRIAFATALAVWIVTSLVATVEESRTTWLLLAMTALAGRLATEDLEALGRCFGGNFKNNQSAFHGTV
ncbi:MAG TPA: O-antigen ligase family protein [Terracidiphilus sp.]|jgi:O-antigen ligase